jgi:hypothetical protein
MESVLSVENADLKRLGPDQAVDLFRELLWAEATALGIGKNLINVPSAITVADGGIDAEVNSPLESSGQGIIKQGLSRYQIKTGPFSLSRNSNVAAILFAGKGKSKALKPKIKSCLDRGGRLVVVLFGWDDPDPAEKLTAGFRTALARVSADYKDADIEVWQQNHIRGFLKPFPSLALRLNGRGHSSFQTHRSWQRQSDMKVDFVAGTSQQQFTSALQTNLRRHDQAVHLRIFGEPGIGKTRLVLEATKTTDLSPLVVYVEGGSRFRDSELMNEILRDDSNLSAVLVIDECGTEATAFIWNKLSTLGNRIKLITIYGEVEQTCGSTLYFRAPPLEPAEITGIMVSSYGVPKEKASIWSGICEGSPRAAHVIGLNLRSNPEDLLRAPDTVPVWERYVVGPDEDPQSPVVTERRLVLQHLAPFKRFGFGRLVEQEARAIATMIQRADPLITWTKFRQIISHLRRRKILRGENTLSITPRVFHIKLWNDWWHAHGDSFDLEEFLGGLSGGLAQWFERMFEYAAVSDAARGVVRDLLGASGPFQDGDRLRTRLGSELFLRLTHTDPRSALRCLQRAFAGCSKEDLTEFTMGRRQVVWSLERIVVWRDLFPDAARLLLALGEAENETGITNNASGVFAELFSHGPGPVAPTEAPPHERFAVLVEALRSDSKERRAIGLNACECALRLPPFVGTIGANGPWLSKQPARWRPRSDEEWLEAYRRVWYLLSESLNFLPGDDLQRAAAVLLRHATSLTFVEPLAEMVVETVGLLAQRSDIDRRLVVGEILTFLSYDRPVLPAWVKERWEQMRDSLVGTDFSALMERYVGMKLLGDGLGEPAKLVSRNQEQLARQAVDAPETLIPELKWLVTDRAQNGFAFGYELGMADEHLTLLDPILRAQIDATEGASGFFLSGYCRAIRNRNEQAWEILMDALLAGQPFVRYAAELTGRCGLSDRGALRLLNLAKTGSLSDASFGGFRYGGEIEDLSEKVFVQWTDHLLASPEPSTISIVLGLFQRFYLRCGGPQPPEDLTLRVLSHPSLLAALPGKRRDQMDYYYWKALATAFIALYPEGTLELGDLMIEHFEEVGTIFDDPDSSMLEVLDKITARHPTNIWKLITKRIAPTADGRAGDLTEYLPRAMQHIPAPLVWAWVDEDVDQHAWYLATVVPKVLYPLDGDLVTLREVLVRYGDRPDVRVSASSNIHSFDLWIGEVSTHFASKKEWLLDLRNKEDNENVKRWIDEYVEILDGEIDHAKVMEERQD